MEDGVIVFKEQLTILHDESCHFPHGCLGFGIISQQTMWSLHVAISTQDDTATEIIGTITASNGQYGHAETTKRCRSVRS